MSLVLSTLQRSLALLNNLDRAKNAISNDEILKSNKDLGKFWRIFQ